MQTPPLALAGVTPPTAPAEPTAGQPDTGPGFAETLAAVLGAAPEGQAAPAPTVVALTLAPPALLVTGAPPEATGTDPGPPLPGLDARLDRTTEADSELAAALAALLSRLQPAATAADAALPVQLAPVAPVTAVAGDAPALNGADVEALAAPAAPAAAVLPTPVEAATAATTAAGPALAPPAPGAPARVDATAAPAAGSATAVAAPTLDATTPDGGSLEDDGEPAAALFELERSATEQPPEDRTTAVDDTRAAAWIAPATEFAASDTLTPSASASLASAAQAPTPSLAASRGPAELSVVALDASDRAAFTDSLAETVRGASLRGDHELRLALNPPDLGRVDVRISDGDGGLTVHIQTATAEAHDLVQQQLSALRAGLELRELRVERLQVEQQQATDGAFGGADAERREPRGGQQPGDGQAPAWSPVAALQRGTRPGQVLRGGTLAAGTLDVRA